MRCACAVRVCVCVCVLSGLSIYYKSSLMRVIKGVKEWGGEPGEAGLEDLEQLRHTKTASS